MGLLDVEGVVTRLGRSRSSVTIGPVSFRVAPGTVTALVGRSGSGKSTVLSSVAGLTRPTSGRVVFDGEEITRASDRRLARLRREEFGFVFQDYTLIDPLTGRENIELPARMSRRRLDAETLSRLAGQLGLNDRWTVTTDQLSGGQRQRVSDQRMREVCDALAVAVDCSR